MKEKKFPLFIIFILDHNNANIILYCVVIHCVSWELYILISFRKKIFFFVILTKVVGVTYMMSFLRVLRVSQGVKINQTWIGMSLTIFTRKKRKI